jgi:hypothetical protein
MNDGFDCFIYVGKKKITKANKTINKMNDKWDDFLYKNFSSLQDAIKNFLHFFLRNLYLKTNSIFINHYVEALSMLKDWYFVEQRW